MQIHLVWHFRLTAFHDMSRCTCTCYTVVHAGYMEDQFDEDWGLRSKFKLRTGLSAARRLVRTLKPDREGGS